MKVKLRGRGEGVEVELNDFMLLSSILIDNDEVITRSVLEHIEQTFPNVFYEVANQVSHLQKQTKVSVRNLL